MLVNRKWAVAAETARDVGHILLCWIQPAKFNAPINNYRFSAVNRKILPMLSSDVANEHSNKSGNEQEQ
jgi:hypothetical protein